MATDNSHDAKEVGAAGGISCIANFYAVHHGELHWFDKYDEYPSGNWAIYIAQNGSKYGIETDLIAKSSQEAATKFIAKQARMVERNLKEAREAADRAETWAASLHRFSLTGLYSPNAVFRDGESPTL